MRNNLHFAKRKLFSNNQDISFVANPLWPFLIFSYETQLYLL